MASSEKERRMPEVARRRKQHDERRSSGCSTAGRRRVHEPSGALVIGGGVTDGSVSGGARRAGARDAEVTLSGGGCATHASSSARLEEALALCELDLDEVVAEGGAVGEIAEQVTREAVRATAGMI